ncbi:MAG: F0F1 ATP synthase subunit A [Dehalococcoidales bacterium]|nr:F0F1 ATP synthase subunit A [Dehalococcoidales bacterium]
MPNKKRLGCSPLITGIIVIFLALFVLDFLAGPLGKSLFRGLNLPAWLSLPRPEPQLPAEEVFTLFGFPITNSIVGAWFTIIVLVLLSYLVTRGMKLVPGRLQTAFEFVLGSLFSFCASVAGEKKGRLFFPVVATIFLFVIFNAWLGLLPGFGSITIVNPEGKVVHLLRPANTDINMPMALAIISFFFVEITGLRAHGFRYLSKFINLGPLFKSLGQIATGKVKAGVSGLITGIVYAFVGILELLSEFVRIVSFTFRLFGVSTAGEILLLVGVFLGIRVLIEFFYGLEILFGFVQALIFSGLTLVFLTVATAAHGDEHEEKSHSD